MVNGIWGHLSVGLFADPPTGPKSLFVDGSLYRLKVQGISVLCVTIFSFIATFILIKLVDWTIGIRLSEEDEIAGCDPMEHDIYPEEYDYPLMPTTKIDNLESISVSNKFMLTPTPHKYVMNSSPFERNSESLNHRRTMNVNEAYERD